MQTIDIQKTKSTLTLEMYCGLHFHFCRAHYHSCIQKIDLDTGERAGNPPSKLYIKIWLIKILYTLEIND
jgi:hypothetical protein